MTEQELRKQHAVFQVVWQYYKRFAGQSITDEFWDELVFEGDRIYKDHGKDELCMRLLGAIQDYFEAKEGSDRGDRGTL